MQDHGGLIYTIAKRYLPLCDRATDIDDLMQAGHIGVIRAEKTYNPSKGAFGTWAGYYIQSELQAALGLRGARIRAHREAVSLDEPHGEEGGTLAETISDPSANFEEKQEAEELRAVVRARVEAMENERQREIVKRCDLDGQTVAAASKALGLTVGGAGDLKRRAHGTLRLDKSLKALAEAHDMDRRTNWHYHTGYNTWRYTWLSSTERLAYWRIWEQRRGKPGAAL
ncbi:MAG: sigma-70 family RNA polymerase sigma factor [Candidatus Limiplasma sp.]|nr:sigma-70 family RNA polymerase sigma factor [Candidatus Limiplasma sp.]